ncbi:beta-galactosidase [Neobacillus drentensis]|uniref:beta-galactosidase n=1 Tax=Neobacillus drentensis TaxID=220684 RepID=UPI0030033D27
MSIMNKTSVQLSKQGISINGKPTIILCASVFYFRIPMELWKDRLEKVKMAGYNCIDVYFPWNFHETQRDLWDFTDDKDVEAFLQMAAEEGLYVVARPGPYICSEWDGGALPAYLFTNTKMRLRDNDSVFLEHVGRWFDRILPILKRYELGQKGSIICVQLDNELDFFGCQDPTGYISALRDMAFAHDLEVPLVACAGQGDLFKASGNSKGVIPTCNFYPNDRDPEFESKVHEYVERLGNQNLPLMVTETNRSHFLLRRLLAAGAKLLGPYLQVSGTNFGFTNAANNWGNPLSFLTSDYDFGGMISSTGEVRAEALEGRLMSRILGAVGESLAQSVYSTDHELTLGGALSNEVTGPNALELQGGGYLYSLPNVSDNEQTVSIQIGDHSYPKQTKMTISKGRCPLLLAQTPLSHWGFQQGMLEFASAELFYSHTIGNHTILVFSGEGESELSFRMPELMNIETDGGIQVTRVEGSDLVFTANNGVSGSAFIILASGQVLEVRLLQREKALNLREVTADGSLVFDDLLKTASDADVPSIQWGIAPLNAGAPELGESSQHLGDKADFLENRGIYRGYAWYQAKIHANSAHPVHGVLLQDASDICSVYTDDTFHGTVVPGGGSLFVTFKEETSGNKMKLVVRSEIWGHSNFNDARLPAFHLNGQKGLTGAAAVTNILKLNSNWRFKAVRSSSEHASYTNKSCETETWPIVNWGSWMTEHHPSYGYYKKTFYTSPESNAWFLHLPGTRSLVAVFVNGYEAGKVNPLTPYLDLSPWIKSEEENQLTLFLETFYSLETGDVILYEGLNAIDWELTSAGEKELWSQALIAQSNVVATDLPVELLPGSSAWLMGKIDQIDSTNCWKVMFSGTNIKLSIFFNGRLIGRIWTPSKTSRPQMRGGNERIAYVPRPWIQEQGDTLAILLESTEPDEIGVLEEIRFSSVSTEI